MRIRSLRFRISILYSLLLGFTLLIFSAILYFSLSNLLYNDLDAELGRKARAIDNAIRSYLRVSGDQGQSFDEIAKRLISMDEVYLEDGKVSDFEKSWLHMKDILDLELDYVVFRPSAGGLVTRSQNVSAELDSFFFKFLPLHRDEEVSFRNVGVNKQRLRLINHRFPYGEGGDYTIQIGTSIKPIIEILSNRQGAILLSIFVIVGISFFIGRIFVDRIMSPVRDVVSLARTISSKDLSARLELRHADHEMEYLINGINEMIARLEKSFRYIMEFSSDVAHELKTPLTILKGESEITLEKGGLSPECQELIQSNLEELDRMLQTVEDLLLLTKLEYRPEIFRFETLELNSYMKEIFDQTLLLASEKNIRVSLDLPEESRRVQGDKNHLRRLFYNLIQNAIRFTSPGGEVGIGMKYDEMHAHISISDTGIGIPREDLPNIFNKFFHMNRTGRELETGCGLGLSIALQIAKIHNGQIEVRSVFGEGSVFTVSLPLA
jgi:two-component system heavy metal sensor histidine kinase CusS